MLSGTRQIGASSKEPSRKLDLRLTISFTPDIAERIRRFAHRRKLKMSPMIRVWIEEVLAREEQRLKDES